MRTGYAGWAKTIGLPALLTGITFLASAQAQEKTEQRTIRGTVRSFTIAPKGETNGLLLDDDTEVRFPKHLADKVKETVAKGDRVRVTGSMNTGPKGDTHFKALSITNLDTNKTFDVEGPEITKRGTVRRFTTAPKGEVDGVILDDDSEVRFPPHLGDRVKSIVNKGDRVRVTGRSNTGPKGDTAFRATSITNLDTSKSFEILSEPPPIAPKDKGAKGKKGKAKKHKEKGPKEKDFEGKEQLRAPRQEPDRPTDLQARIQSLEADLRRLRQELERSRRQD